MSPKRWLIVMSVAIATVVGGCDARPEPIVRGPCTLAITTEDPELLGPPEDRELLGPPFHVDMASHGSANIFLHASGWRGVIAMTLTRPDDGTVLAIDDAFQAPAFNVERSGITFDVVGPWRVTLRDAVAGCFADFVVEVRP